MRRALALVALAFTACAPHVEVARTEAMFAPGTADSVYEMVQGELVQATVRPVGLALYQKLYGSPHYLGVIDCTNSSKTNHQATTPFNNTGAALCSKVLLIQPSATTNVLPVNTNTGTVTTATGVSVGGTERVIITMEDSQTNPTYTYCWLACITSSTSNLSVWELF